VSVGEGSFSREDMVLGVGFILIVNLPFMSVISVVKERFGSLLVSLDSP